MRDTDAAYIAALIDSIGTIKIDSIGRGQDSQKVYCLYVWITHKDYKLMEFLQRAGAYVIQLDDGKYRARWKDQRASILLRSILPYSKMRKEQVIVGIEFAKAMPQQLKDEKFYVPYLLRLKMLKADE